MSLISGSLIRHSRASIALEIKNPASPNATGAFSKDLALGYPNVVLSVEEEKTEDSSTGNSEGFRKSEFTDIESTKELRGWSHRLTALTWRLLSLPLLPSILAHI